MATNNLICSSSSKSKPLKLASLSILNLLIAIARFSALSCSFILVFSKPHLLPSSENYQTYPLHEEIGTNRIY